MSDEQQPPSDTPDPGFASVQRYLLYTLSLPERALRGSSGMVGGALRHSTSLLVPQAFQNSKTYTVLVRQMLDFMIEDIAGVENKDRKKDDEPKVENFVARKAVGNFVEMAGLATLHLSPITLLAVVSDIAYGSQAYLHELRDELVKQGVIDADSTINHAGDLLAAIGQASGTTASAFDTPPLSVEGLRQTIEQTREAVEKIDPKRVLPEAEARRMWNEMRAIAEKEGVSVLDVSSAMTLHALGKIGNVGRGGLSSVRVIGSLVDRHVINHYKTALRDIHQRGYYTILAETSGPYISAVWKNFSTEKSTLTEDLLSGKLLGQAAGAVRRWLGEPDESDSNDVPGDSP